jgi:D-glycero-D-manno-heptose 1,7-bisphosphate phosphatase
MIAALLDQRTVSASAPPLAYARLRLPLTGVDGPRGALFLDRDGVVNEDVGYLHRPEDVTIRPGIAATIADARRQGMDVVIVTNQSGVGRGYYGWADFERVQDTVERQLRDECSDAFVSMVCACPFHRDAKPPYDVDGHPWRKPNPGMILFAASILDIDLSRSIMIGNERSDELAAQAAGVEYRHAN